MPAANNIEWHQVEAMTEYCKQRQEWRNLLILLIPCTSGYRHCDWQKLRWCDVMGASIKRVEQKTDKRRDAPLTKYVSDQIQAAFDAIQATIPPSQRPAMAKDFIFKPVSKNSSTGVLTRAGVNGILDKIRKAVGIPHTVTVHSLRKAYGMRLYTIMGETESAMIWISNWFNHSSLQITQRYLGLETKMRAEIMDQMWR